MSSPINKKELEHLAALSRIELSEKEEIKLLKDLEVILDHFEELKLLDTSSVFPMSGGTSNRSAARDDEERINTNQGLGKDAFPEKEGGSLKIPKVF